MARLHLLGIAFLGACSAKGVFRGSISRLQAATFAGPVTLPVATQNGTAYLVGQSSTVSEKEDTNLAFSVAWPQGTGSAMELYVVTEATVEPLLNAACGLNAVDTASPVDVGCLKKFAAGIDPATFHKVWQLKDKQFPVPEDPANLPVTMVNQTYTAPGVFKGLHWFMLWNSAQKVDISGITVTTATGFRGTTIEAPVTFDSGSGKAHAVAIGVGKGTAVSQSSMVATFSGGETDIIPAYFMDGASWESAVSSGVFTMDGDNHMTIDLAGTRWKSVLGTEIQLGAKSGAPLRHNAPEGTQVDGMYWVLVNNGTSDLSIENLEFVMT